MSTMAQQFLAQAQQQMGATQAPVASSAAREPWYERAWDAANKPLLDLHRSGAGPVEGAAEDFASGLTSPVSLVLALATMGESALGEAGAEGLTGAIHTAGKLMSAGFTGQQIFAIAHAAPQFLQAVESDDYDRAKYIGTQLLLGAGTTALGARALMKGGAGAAAGAEPAPTAPPEAVPISDEAAHARYEQMPETAGGRMVSADLYKKVLIDEPADTAEGRIEQNNAVHERNSDLARERFLDALQHPEEDKPQARLVAAAPGAGKSVALASGVAPESRATYEGTFSDFEKTRSLLQAAIDSGHEPHFTLVHADPEVLADRIAERAKTEGRLPSADYVAEKALEVPGTAERLAQHFGDKVQWHLLDNSVNGQPPVRVDGLEPFLQHLDERRYTGTKNDLAEQIRSRYQAQGGAETGPSDGHDGGGNLASGGGVPQAASGEVPAGAAAGQSAAVTPPSGPLARIWNFIQQMRSLPDWTPYKNIIGHHFGNLQASAIDTAQEVQEMRKAVPQLARRQALTRWVEAQGDPDVIRQRLAEAESIGNKQSVKEHAAALSLTPDELDVAEKFKQRMQEMLELGQRVGALGEGVENYVPHLWQKLPGPEDGQTAQVGYEGQSGVLNTDLAAAKKRVFGTLHEGEMLGKVPQTTDLAQIYGLYRRGLDKAISSREMVAALRTAYGTDARPLVMYQGVGRRLGAPGYALSMAEDQYDPKMLTAIQAAMHTPENPISQALLERAERGGLIEKEGQGTLVRPRVLPSTKLTTDDRMRLGRDRLENAIADGNVIMDEDGPDGKPVYRWTTNGYREISSRALQKVRFLGADSGGKPIMLESSAMVHPEIYEHLKNAIAPESPFRKNAALNLLMHASSGAKQTLLSLSPFHWLQEGLRGVQAGVNSPQLFLDSILKRNPIDVSDPKLKALLDHGLMLHDVNGREDYAEGLAAHGGLVSKIPGIGHVNNAIGDALFHEFIPRLKAASALADLERFRNAYPDLKRNQLYQLAANKANATFGGLNYKLMGRSAAMQDLSRLAFLAPDWLESNLRAAGGSFGKYGSPYRGDLARIFAYNFAVARMLNLMNTGQLHTEHPLGVVSQDGKHVWTVRTMPSDIMHMLTDPRSFVWNRLNPMLTRIGMEAGTGRDQWGHERSGMQQVEDIGRNVLPIPVQGIPGLRTSREETNAEAVGRAMGFTELPNRTDAEKLAMQFGSQKVPSGIVSDAQQAHSAALRQLVEGMRSGKLRRDDVVAQVQQGKIAPADAGRVIEESKVSPLAWQVSRLGIDQALQVYQAGTPQEKQELRPIVESKVMHWRRGAWKTMTPTELHATMQKIAAVLGTNR